MAKENLKDKTIKGIGWSAADNILQYAISFVVSIILARLLTPDDYGLIGLTNIFSIISTAIIGGGFTSALIRKKDVTEQDYCTAFIINIGFSLIIYVSLYFSAPYISHFFGRTKLIALIRVLCLSLIIEGLSVVQRAMLNKRIDFKSQTKITLIGSVIGGFVGIAMALCGYGVWALVAYNLTASTFKTILLWVYNKWMPNFFFSIKSFKDLFNYSWKMLATDVINATWKELKNVVVGKFYSPAYLGQYTRSVQFAQLFSTNLTQVFQRVSFPVLSEIQDDSSMLKYVYRKIIKDSTFITFILMLGLAAISKPLIVILIGEKWLDAARYLPLICLSSMLYPLHAINLNMLQVKGRSDLFLKLEIVKKIIAIIPLAIGIIFNIYWMLVAEIVNSFICFYLNSYFSGPLLGYSTSSQIKDILPSLGVAVLVAIPVFLFSFIPLSYYVLLPIQCILMCLLTILICHLLKIEEYFDIIQIVKPYLTKYIK